MQGQFEKAWQPQERETQHQECTSLTFVKLQARFASRAGRGAVTGWKPGDTWPEQGCPCPQPAPRGNSTNKAPGGAQQSEPSCSAGPPAASLFCGQGGKENTAYSTASPKQALCHTKSLTGPLGWEEIIGNWGEKRQMENCSR